MFLRNILTEAETTRGRRATQLYGVAALAVVGVLLWSLLAPDPWSRLFPLRVDVQIDEVVYRVTEPRWQQALERSRAVLSERQQAALLAMDAEVQVQVARAFRLPRDNVADTLDWYYSMSGQAARAGMTAWDWLDRNGAAERRVPAALGARLFPADDWAQAQAQLVSRLMHGAAEHTGHALDASRATLHGGLAAYRVDAPTGAPVQPLVFDIDASALRDALADDPALTRQALAVSAATLGTVAGRSALRAAAIRTAAARAAGRGAAVPATAACAGTGPFALACAAGVFTATLVATEYVVLRLDEARNREALEAAFHDDLDRLEQAVAQALGTALRSAMTTEFETRRTAVERQVRPIDLLFGAR